MLGQAQRERFLFIKKSIKAPNMTESRWNPEKPVIISAICVIGLINAIQMLNLILSPMAKQAGAIYPLYFSVSVLICLVWPVVSINCGFHEF